MQAHNSSDFMRKFFCNECSYVYNPLVGEEEYDIAPGTDFENIEDFSCPSCGAPKENFIAPKEEIHTVLDKNDLLEIEEMHVPRYHFEEDTLVVTLGTEENPCPNEEDHIIEWVAVFDENGDMADIVYSPVSRETRFEGFEETDPIIVRSSCNVHGVWEGITR